MDDPQRAESTLNRLPNAASSCRSTTSAPAIRRWPTSSGCRSMSSRSTSPFVMNMEKDEDDAKIVRSTIDLAHNLGLSVVAEGVENQLIWDKLRELHCDEAQGYFMSKPLARLRVRGWCTRWHARS
jgi:hypothetical protein